MTNSELIKDAVLPLDQSFRDETLTGLHCPLPFHMKHPKGIGVYCLQLCGFCMENCGEGKGGEKHCKAKEAKNSNRWPCVCYSKEKCISLELQLIQKWLFVAWLTTPLCNHSPSLSLLNHRLGTLPRILATTVSGLCNCFMNHGGVCGWEVCVCVRACIHASACSKLVLWNWVSRFPCFRSLLLFFSIKIKISLALSLEFVHRAKEKNKCCLKNRQLGG